MSLTNRVRTAEIDDGSGWRYVETDSKELTVPFSRLPGGIPDVPTFHGPQRLLTRCLRGCVQQLGRHDNKEVRVVMT